MGARTNYLSCIVASSSKIYYSCPKFRLTGCVGNVDSSLPESNIFIIIVHNRTFCITSLHFTYKCIFVDECLKISDYPW